MRGGEGWRVFRGGPWPARRRQVRPFVWAGALALGSLAAGGTALAATVLAIDSGDTLRVRDGAVVRSVRLACLDAPELGQEPHGARAMAALRHWLPAGTAVRLTPNESGNTPPGVVVAEVALEATTVNVELVRAGLAFTTPEAPAGCDPLRYAEAESSARFRRLGVWQVEGGSERPWLWRIAQAEANARAARQRAVEVQQRQDRENRAAQRNASRPSLDAPLGGRVGPLPPNFQPKCVALARQQFMKGSMGVAPPAGSVERFCSCLSKPQKADTTLQALGDRCTAQFLEQVTSAL